MIGLQGSVRATTPSEVSSEMRDAARNRVGEWELVTFDDWPGSKWRHCLKLSPFIGLVPLLRRRAEVIVIAQWTVVGMAVAKWIEYKFNLGEPAVETRVTLSEREVPRMLHIYMHGQRNNTKLPHIHANLEQVAESLWPTGSLEHVSLRILAVSMFVRALSGHECSGDYFGYPRFKSCLVRKASHPGSTLKTTSGANSGEESGFDGVQNLPSAPGGWIKKLWLFILRKFLDRHNVIIPTRVPAGVPVVAEQSVVPEEVITSPALPEVPMVTDEPMPKHGGVSPADAEIIANEQDRTIDKNGVKLVVGVDYDKVDLDNKQIVGVLTMPSPKLPNVYNNSSKNVIAAKRERLVKKAKQYRGSAADRAKITKMVGESCGCKSDLAVFSEDRIRKWTEEHLHLEDIKSGKWTMKRLENSLDNLYCSAYPEYKLKCSVKLEPMQEGKPPRMLIADGDDGQLMALIVVKCFEELLFEWFESKSIKHVSKREAIDRTIKGLTKKNAKLIEGDGSAWDTTCNEKIRELVENPCLRHIAQVVTNYGVVPAQWHEEHLKCNGKAELKLFFNRKFDRVRLKIDAIRRSGHRGTSCLNWWMNFVNWTCSLFREPWRFLKPSTRNGVDETGQKRWWNGCFEGDDSLCAIHPEMERGGELDKIFIGWWERQGFNMKIVYAHARATFCGYHIACVDGEPTGFACPELPRAMCNSGISCSRAIIDAAESEDLRTVKDIAAAGALARAADFAGLLPSVSRKYHAYSLELKGSRDIVNREMSIRVTGEEGCSYNDIESQIESKNLGVTPSEEMGRLEALNCPATEKELDAFVCYPWKLESVDQYSAFLASLPQSWRPANACANEVGDCSNSLASCIRYVSAGGSDEL